MTHPNESWALLTEVYNPDEAEIIHGLLASAGIPVKMERDSMGDLYGLTVGPLARIRIWIPADSKSEAAMILSSAALEINSEEER